MTSKPGFFSLKWKTVLLLSLVLVTINGLLIAMSYFQLQNQFYKNRDDIFQRQNNELNGLIRNSYNNLEKFASFIPAIYLNDQSNKTDSDKLESIFINNETVFNVEWDITSTSFHRSDGELIYYWNKALSEKKSSELISLVIRNEKPVTRFICDHECFQYLATPILFSDNSTGVMIVGKSLADLVLSFSSITGADIAILTDRIDKSFEEDASMISDWNLRVAAITNNRQSTDILNTISSNNRFPSTDEISRFYSYNDKFIELKLANTQQYAGSEFLTLLIDDISPYINEIKYDVSIIVAAGIAGIISSEILLLIFLWFPMRRIVKLANILPSLASGNFDILKKTLNTHPVEKRFPDEIDILSETTLKLGNKLESLNQQIVRNTRKLEQQRDALILERDFNNNLLETAQAIIITHDHNGMILSINDYGTQFTGYEEELPGRDVSMFLSSDTQDHPLADELDAIRKGDILHFNNESRFTTCSGEQKTISWYHSRISSTTDEIVILSMGMDITARHLAETRLSYIAEHDTLTNLYNRRRFHEEFSRIIKESIRYDRTGALMFIDLDHFKIINDTNGHIIGDTLLQKVAESMRNATRNSDLLARLGGDEFALVLPETTGDDALRVSNKIMHNINRIDIPSIDKNYKTSVSIGITLFPDHGTTAQELIGNADIAMYQAKQHGRGIAHMFSINEHAREKLTERIEWKQKISDALTNDDLILQFQPIVNIRDNSISHYEVLVRIVDENMELIPPNAFIPQAEQSGQVTYIDRWVIKQSIKKISEINSLGHRISLSINLSGRVIDDTDLLPFIKDSIRKYNIDPSQLIFEVTETAAVADIGSARRLMTEISSLGCLFSLDDFGVGFSSFYYLKQLPVDYVKIDGAFIHNIVEDPADQLFVKALQEVASGLGKKTIAEYVENQHIMNLLREYNIDYAQGHHIGTPSSVISFEHSVFTDQLNPHKNTHH